MSSNCCSIQLCVSSYCTRVVNSDFSDGGGAISSCLYQGTVTILGWRYLGTVAISNVGNQGLFCIIRLYVSSMRVKEVLLKQVECVKKVLPKLCESRKCCYNKLCFKEVLLK